MNICPNCGGDIDVLEEMFPDGWTTCEELQRRKTMKILSDEEILKVAEPYVDFDYKVLDLDKAIAQAQLGKVIELLDGIENPYQRGATVITLHKCNAFNEAIQTIRALLGAGNGS